MIRCKALQTSEEDGVLGAILSAAGPCVGCFAACKSFATLDSMLSGRLERYEMFAMSESSRAEQLPKERRGRATHFGSQ